MRTTRKMLAVFIAMIMVMSLCLAACGSKTEEAADEGQNPAMNFVGDYVCDRADIYIAAEGEDGMNATVTWGGSAWATTVWTMSGTFDAETLQFEYHDCVKTDYEYDDAGDVTKEEEVYTGGHGFMTFTESDTLSLTWQDDQEHAADGMTFGFVGVMPESGSVGMANPWSTADSLEKAAEGAGLDGFSIPEGDEISLGKIEVSEYRYMTDLAEAVVEFPAVQMTFRKANAIMAVDGDISGDYNTYANKWTQNIKGLEVTCYGNREGEATKTIWQNPDGNLYSITAFGLGGDTDFGLSADDLNSLINGIQ